MIIIVNSKKDLPLTSHPQTIQDHDDALKYLIQFLIALGYDPAFTPLASLLASSYDMTGECLMVSPIHWEASHNDVMITAHGEALQLSESLVKIWFYELAEFFAHDGFKLIDYDGKHWFVLPSEGHTINAPNVSAMRDRSMMPVLSELDDTLYWQRLMTEIQMFMSQHPLNTQKNQPLTVNGLWFWGGGGLDKPLNQSIYTDSAPIRKVFTTSKPLEMIDFSDRDAIVVMEQYDPLMVAHYEKHLQHQNVRWIWNQCEYTTRARWFSRLRNYFK